MDDSASKLSGILNDLNVSSDVIKKTLKLEQHHLTELESVIEHDLDNIQQSSLDRPALIIVYLEQYAGELRELIGDVRDKRLGKDLLSLVENIEKFREDFASKLKRGWYINDEEKRIAINKFFEGAKKILYDLLQAQEDVKEAEDKFSNAGL